MANDDHEKSIRIISFSGKKEDWSVWEEKFLARARRKGYKKILKGKEKAPKDSIVIDNSNAAGKELERMQEANENAYEDLILSINTKNKSGEVAFAIIKGCKTTEFADGDAFISWTRLLDKYASKSTPLLLKLKKEFTNSVMKNNEDPDEWITGLEATQTRIKEIVPNKVHVQISDDDLMIHVLNYLPKKSYDIEKAACEKELEKGTLTITNLREELRRRYDSDIKDNMSEDEEESDTALFAKQFKGRCHRCGKWGHKSTECKDKDNKGKGGATKTNGGGNKNSKKCTHCGRTGHLIDQCWKKQKEDKATLATDDDDIVLIAGDFEKCSLKRKSEVMDWDMVELEHTEKQCVKKVKSWHQTSWEEFTSPVKNSWSKGCEGWSMVRSNNPLKKRTSKGVPGLNPYTQIKLN